MDGFLDFLLGILSVIYRERWVAPLVLLPMMLAVAGFIHWRAGRMTRPYLVAARRRVAALTTALGTDPDPIAERHAFSADFMTLSVAMNEDGAGTHELIQAWREFQESIIDETSDPVRNTNRPTSFFVRAAPKLTGLTFASNIFVGVGLILTFLGLIVALNTAAKGMDGGDVTAAQASLVGLLTVAGAKFFTSVAGLGASIWLRFAEHGLSKRVNHQTHLMCQLLERGLLYVPPQRLAVEQLEVMREQRDQLKFFNTDVALQLSERIGVEFQQAIAPVTASLSQLSDNMASVTQGIGAGAREAIEKVSGEQLRGLSETLTGLSQGLDAVRQAVGSSSDDAASQIRLAGADFARAATDIRDAFDRLAGQVDGMGSRLTEQGEATSRAQTDTLATMMGGIETAQARSITMISDVINALKTAGSDAANTMQREVSGMLSAGVAESQRTFRLAIEESGEALRETTGSLSKAIGDAAERVERASVSFARTGDHAERSASAMGEVTDKARSAGVSLNDAATGFAKAAAPVADAARAVNEAAQRVARIVEADRAADSLALSEMKALSDGMRLTHEAAETAWHDYRSRFENVDRSLSEATNKLAESLGDSLSAFRTFTQDLDREMASAVSRLANTVTQIEDYAGSLDEFVEATRPPHLEPAE